MALSYAPTVNFKQTTLNGSITSGQTTITLNSVTNLPQVGYIVIDRQDASGNNTPSAREVVSYTSIAGNVLSGCTRGADGSSALAHNDQALVETMPTVGMWNSLTSVVQTGFSADGLLNSVVSAVTMVGLSITSTASIASLQIANLVGVKGHFLWTSAGALATSLATSSNNSQISFLRATKNLTLQNVYVGLNSAPSLGPLQMDVYYKSTPTGVTGTTIFSVRPLVGIGLNDNIAGATVGTLSLTSLASGTLLYPEIRAPGGAGDLVLQLTAVERT